MRIIAGVDPGLGGGVAFLSADGDLETIDMPGHRLKRNGRVKRETGVFATDRQLYGDLTCIEIQEAA